MIVQDENDNPPQFSQAQYTVSLEENSEAGALVATLTASDPDLGLNSLLTYSLLGEDAASFTIDPASGEVRTRWRLDREEKEQLVVVVRAEDGGQDVRLSGSCLLTVVLEAYHEAVLTVVLKAYHEAMLTVHSGMGEGLFSLPI